MLKKLVVIMMTAFLVFFHFPKAVLAESHFPELTFTNDAITETTAGSGYEISGTSLTITSAGVYILSGSCEEGTIEVGKGLSGVVLVLNNLSLKSAVTSPFIVKKGSNVTIHLDGENTLTNNEDPANETSTDTAIADAFEGAAVKVKSGSSAIFCGEGSLTINGNAKNGIKGGAEASLTFNSGVYHVNAINNAIASDGALTFNGGEYHITADNDGIKSVPDVDDLVSVGKIDINGGKFEINVQGDGVQADQELNITNGSMNITTFGGYNTAGFDKDTMSCKGLKASGDRENGENIILISGGDFILNTADDAVHSDGSITITNGTFDIYTGDDGAHAETSLILGTEGGHERDPEITVNASYEGLEGLDVDIYSGRYYVKASDDGINAAGGSSSGTDPSPWDPWGGQTEAGDNKLNIHGGIVYVNCDGDGLDSNGSLSLLGGEVTVYSQARGGDNSALDSDGDLLINGATVFTAGTSTPMDKTPISGSQKYRTYTQYVSAGTLMRVLYSNNLLFNDTLPKNYNKVLYSSPDVTGNVSFYTGGTKDNCKGTSWDHNWDNGTVVTEATAEADGLMVYKCQDCGRTEYKTFKFQNDYNCDGHDSYVALDYDAVTIGIGDSIKLTASAVTKIENPTIVWTSNHEDIASVDQQGKVTGISYGTAIITASVEGTDLSAQCVITVSEDADKGYKVTFETDENTSIDIYYTQDYTVPDETGVTETVSRNSTTGLPDSTGDGQVNFKVNVEEGYEVVDVTAEGSYKNVKTVSEEEHIYRVTKVAGDIVIKVSVRKTPIFINSASVALDEKIQARIYVYVPDTELETTYITTTFNGTTKTEYAKTMDTAVRSGRECRLVTVDTFAKQMRDDIVVKVHEEDGTPKYLEYKGTDVTDGFTFHVADYVDLVEDNSTDELLIDLVHKMNWYGLYAQKQFNYNPVEFEKPDVIANFNDEVLNDYAVQNTGTADGIEYTSGSLQLDSDTGVKVNYTLTGSDSISDYTFTVDGTEVQPVLRSGKKYYVTISGMAAKELDTVHTITVTDKAGNELTTKYSGLSYAYAVVSNAGAPDTLKDLCRSIYLYWEAADKYFNQ